MSTMAILYQVDLLYLGTSGLYTPEIMRNDRQLILSGQSHMTRRIIRSLSSLNRNDSWKMVVWTLMSVNLQLLLGSVVGE